jgi:hypothetical protein
MSYQNVWSPVETWGFGYKHKTEENKSLQNTAVFVK